MSNRGSRRFRAGCYPLWSVGQLRLKFKHLVHCVPLMFTQTYTHTNTRTHTHTHTHTDTSFTIPLCLSLSLSPCCTSVVNMDKAMQRSAMHINVFLINYEPDVQRKRQNRPVWPQIHSRQIHRSNSVSKSKSLATCHFNNIKISYFRNRISIFSLCLSLRSQFSTYICKSVFDWFYTRLLGDYWHTVPITIKISVDNNYLFWSLLWCILTQITQWLTANIVAEKLYIFV